MKTTLLVRGLLVIINLILRTAKEVWSAVGNKYSTKSTTVKNLKAASIKCLLTLKVLVRLLSNSSSKVCRRCLNAFCRNRNSTRISMIRSTMYTKKECYQKNLVLTRIAAYPRKSRRRKNQEIAWVIAEIATNCIYRKTTDLIAKIA